MKRIACLLLAYSLALSVLTSTPVLALDRADNATAEFERGQQFFDAGNLQRSLAVLRTFVQRYPDHPRAAEAYTRIARIFTRQQRYHDALLYLEQIPEIERSPQARFLTGYNLVQIGDYAAGRQALLPLLEEALDTEDRLALLRSLVEATIEEQQPLQALVFLQKALPLTDNPAGLLKRAHQLLQNRLSESELAEATYMWQQTAIGLDAKLQLARRVLGQQRGEDARPLLQQILASTVPFPYRQEAEMLLRRLNTDSWFNRDSIGVLLPLSGRYASYGELVRNGLELALREHNKSRLPVRFIYRDTGREDVGAGQLVSSLADDDKVMAIVGPLLGSNAEAAAVRAQLELVPLLTLSQRSGLPQQGDYVFRDTLTPQQQVQALVRYAIDSGHISFSVLHPENQIGEQMTEYFVDEVRRLGGEIVDVVSYPEGTTDFQKQIQTLLWEDHVVDIKQPDTPATDGQPADESPPELEYPLAPFHALFIPEYAEQVALLAPQLKFYGLKDVTLLGINGWNSPELASRAGRFLEQAVFVDGFFPDSRQPEVKRFVELYRQVYHDEPTILEAQAFEAANLLLQVMDDPNVTNRDDFRRKLAGLSNFRGVAGAIGFDELGEAIKRLYLLQVKRGRITELY